MDKRLRDYAALLGCVVRTYTFDGGQMWEVRAPGSLGVWRQTVEWGEEELASRYLRAWLDRLPWLDEDDPRVTTEY